MKRITLAYFFALFLILASRTVFAQSADTTKSHPQWTHAIITSLNLSEAAYTNWVAGGENTLAYTGIVNGKSEDNTSSVTWSNTYKFTFGQARLATQGLRKTDDEIDLESLLKYKIDSTVNPYAAVTFQSQFAPGYTYNNNDSATEVSNFFDPAYITQSVGALYTPVSAFKTRLGVAAREIITSQFTQYSVDPETGKIQKFLVEGGFESCSELALPIDDDVLLLSKLTLFAPWKRLDQIVVRSEDGLAVKVGKHFTVNLNALFINDVSVSPRTQIKQTLSVGFVYALL